MLENLKEFAKQNNVPISKDDTMEFIIKTINENNFKQILEIGTAIGFGSINMAKNTNCFHIDTVEIDEKTYIIAKENVIQNKVDDKVTLHNIDAKIYIENCDKKYDFIYLDGPKGQYINYLPQLLNLLNEKGIIIADNIFFHGMVTNEIETPPSCRSMIKGLHNFVDFITTNENLNSHIYNIGDGVALIKKK